MKNPDPVAATDIAAFVLDEVPAPLFEHDGTIYRAGKLFESGDYPDKEFSMTPDELSAAVEAFQSGDAPIDIEHMPTVLSDRLGEVVTVEASDDNKELRGIVALPKWLDDALGASARKVSATWNRTSKRLEGLALVLNPRVKSAALMAAFSQAQEGTTGMTQPAAFVAWDRAAVDSLPDTSFLWVAENGTRYLPVRDKDGRLDLPQLADAVRRLAQPAAFSGTSMVQDDVLGQAQTLLRDATASLESLALFAVDRHMTPEGQGTLQTIHDHTARSGAVCKAPSSDPAVTSTDTTTMAARHEATALQKIHDLTSDHGAQCSSTGGSSPSPFSAATETPAPAAKSEKSERKGSRMGTIWERFVKFMADNPEAVDDLAASGRAVEAADRAATGGSTATTAAAGQSAEMSKGTSSAAARSATEEENQRLRGELAAEQAENRRISAQRIADDAVRFADGYIREGQAFPTERAQIMQAFIQASTDDHLLPHSVTFADGQPGSRVAVLKAAYDARPAHQLTSESLGAGVFAVLANAPTTETNASRAEKPMAPEDVKKLIESTALGRAAMGIAANGTHGANGVNGSH